MIRALALFACCLGLSSLARGDKPDDAVAAELKAMVGRWKVVKAELGGQNVLDQLKTMKFEITSGGKYTAQMGREKDVGTFTVNPAKTPKELDVKPISGPQKGMTLKGIYQLNGDTLTACYDASNTARPSKFEAKEGTTVLLITYKREKK